MEKHSNQMDLDEWEVLSDDGFFELHHHDTRCSKKVLTIDSGFDDYFICPSPKKSLVPVTTIQLELNKEEEQIVVVKEMIKVPIVEIKTPKLVLVGGDDQDTISQVFFFKKMKENVDMKLDSPKSVTRGGIKASSIQFEDKEEEQVTENEKKIDDDQEEAVVVKNYLDSDMKRRDQTSLEGSSNGGGGGGLQIWKWRITGIGALCSMGITAATTICIFIIGNRKKQHHQQQNQKYRIQIYAEDQKSDPDNLNTTIIISSKFPHQFSLQKISNYRLCVLHHSSKYIHIKIVFFGLIIT
ncbi:hypothetical protein MKW94_006941 [Papaver nudicaule]|uniref:DUF6821 domain-containing protein n=1 Tax=Papaver nudicaule TaxID=74823 RepID=A0AA41VVR1_PAPNU|nr:hypothetical protein [Papaver nudicaule]